MNCRKQFRRTVPWTAISILLFAGTAQAAVEGRMVEYRHGDVVLEGYLARDPAKQGELPGILVVHEWKGLNDYAKRRADQLAEIGCVAFAVDMYGKGVYAKDHEEAGKLSGAFRNDRQLMRDRVMAGLNTLMDQPGVDLDRLAAIGYCFGGMAVLELARTGIEIRGVVSFHGGLDTPTPAFPGTIKAKTLVLTGADDPFVKPEQVAAFEKEMKESMAEYRVIVYPGAVHAFTVPEAGSDSSTGAAYNAEADRKSWQKMKEFLAQVLG